MRLAPAVLVLAGCAGWGEVTPLDRGHLGFSDAQYSHPGHVRGTAVIEVESPWLAGTFTAALAARTGADPRVRLHLIPDLGGKALDLLADPDRIRATFPHSGETYEARLSEGPPPHPALFIGLTLLEMLGPQPPVSRIEAARDEGELRVYRLRPVTPGTEAEYAIRLSDLHHSLPIQGTYRLRWKGVAWTFSAAQVTAPGVRIRVSNRRMTPATAEVEERLR